jgi:transposase
LIYYPPYHSKYNPIERVWGVLENHWKGQLLDSVEKVIGLAKSMKYNGNKSVVKLISGTYEKGIKLTQKASN